MGTRVVDRIEEWNQRPFDGGFRGLQNLATQEFSGVVRTDGVELFMSRGVAVGISGGDIDTFEDASGTIHDAPSPALPLLAVMQERSEEVRDSFYTEQTALSEVDGALSEGGFTGYVELSENVLSGDYYVVYHAGTSTSVAFVGQSSRLVDGEEAFQTANDEVGIYQVRPVDIEPLDLPTPEPTSEATDGPQSAAEPSDSVREREQESANESDDSESVREQESANESDDSESVREQESANESDDSESVREQETADDGQDTAAAAIETNPQESDAGGTGETDDHPGGGEATSATTAPETEGAKTGDDPDAAVSGADLEVRTIPSVEPARTAYHAPTESDDAGTTDADRTTPDKSTTDAETTDTAPADADTTDNATADAGTAGTETVDADDGQDERDSDSGDERATVESADLERLEQRVQDLEREREELRERLERARTERDERQEQLERARAERDELREQLERVRAERDELREQLEQVRAERDELAASSDSSDTEKTERVSEGSAEGAGATRDLTSEQALAETVVFVRYRSQSDVTLTHVHDGHGDRESLQTNLQLETYGGFERSVTVDGQPYRTYVEATPVYQFLEWVVTDLPFEIRETGNQKALQGLYDALPKIDHADLQAAVEVGEDVEQFDVVFRDQRGRPLLVARINDSREPVTEAQMEQLVTAADRVGAASDSLQAAFLVTRSYFDGQALAVADDATKGRLLSRNKRKSFVSQSSNQGYHLCLVEAREGAPHLAVPDL